VILGTNPLHARLKKELQKQIEICEKSRDLFQRLGNAPNTLFYDRLLAVTLKDLTSLQTAAASGIDPPKYNLVEITLPVLERNEEVAENIIELRITQIESLQLQSGWQAHHLATFVAYNFPYPHEQHQEGKTQVVKGTVDPTFSDVISLNVQRKSAQLARICRRAPLKLEVYQKGGFMRSDKLWYQASVPLGELISKATVTQRVNLLEGRRGTSGYITVEVGVCCMIFTQLL